MSRRCKNVSGFCGTGWYFCPFLLPFPRPNVYKKTNVAVRQNAVSKLKPSGNRGFWTSGVSGPPPHLRFSPHFHQLSKCWSPSRGFSPTELYLSLLPCRLYVTVKWRHWDENTVSLVTSQYLDRFWRFFRDTWRTLSLITFLTHFFLKNLVNRVLAQ
jgi:hypothetical protein